MSAVTFSTSTANYELPLADAYSVLNYLGMPIQDFGLNHSLPATEFSERVRGAWQVNVMLPKPGGQALTERLRDLVHLADQAREGSVSWHL